MCGPGPSMCRPSRPSRWPGGSPPTSSEWFAHEIGALRDSLIEEVRRVVPDAVLGGDPVDRLPANAHFTFPGCEGDSLLLLLDAQGIECSTGSACTAGVAQPSHVLLATGTDPDLARGTLRFSFGHTSTQADVEAVTKAIGPVVERAQGGRAQLGPVVWTTPGPRGGFGGGSVRRRRRGGRGGRGGDGLSVAGPTSCASWRPRTPCTPCSATAPVGDAAVAVSCPSP